MKFKEHHTHPTLFWFSLVFVIGFLWYILLIPTGAIRRTVVFKNPRIALTSRLVQMKGENTSALYSFEPQLYDSNHRVIYYSCSRKLFWFECGRAGE